MITPPPPSKELPTASAQKASSGASARALPLQRAYLERRIGQLVGIFQIDRDPRQYSDHSEAHALPTSEDAIGLVAIADGGRLSEAGLNAWTVASQMYLEAGCPEDGRIDTSLSALARRLWGDGGKSSERRRRLADALSELVGTKVVITGIDPYTLEPENGAIWEVNLLEGAGARSHVKRILAAARNGDRTALAKLASLRGRADDASATWSIVLPRWLAQSVRRDRGVVLDYEVQRALRGAAKRIWLQLEADPSWTRHRIPTPEDEDDVRRTVARLTDEPLEPTIEPADGDEAIEVDTLVLPLTTDTYRAFGINHRNRKQALVAACANILRHDLTYLRAEVRPAAGTQRRYELHLARAAGDERQRRHRRALRARRGARPPEGVDAT